MSFLSGYSELLKQAFYSDNTANDLQIARGDSLLDEGNNQIIKSEIPGVSDSAWADFVRGMASAKLAAVSPSNALGMFEMMPRRLADLGVVCNLHRTRAPSGRTVWTASFVPPMTSEKFLRSPQVQYRVFATSMRNYVKRIASGEIEKDPNMSLSGALAILHKAGPNGLKSWKTGQIFPATKAIHDKLEGIF